MCVCTFNSINALKVHLAKIHQKTQGAQQRDTAQVTFQCQSCDFSAPCTEAVFLTHLRSTHLKVNHKVQCSFNGCNFHTNVYSTFNVHRSKEHRTHNWRMFRPEIVSGSVTNEMAQEEHEPRNDTSESEDGEDSTNEDLHVLEKQLEHNLAGFFLKMQTVLEEVIQQLLQMCELAQPLLHNAVKDILKQHTDVDDSAVEELVRAAAKNNVIMKFSTETIPSKRSWRMSGGYPQTTCAPDRQSIHTLL